MVIAIMLTPVLLRFTTRKRLTIISTLASGLLFIPLWAVGYGNLGLVVALFLANGFAIGVFMVTQTAMVGDIADYGEVLTGVRHDGVCFAGLTFIAKLGTALAIVLFGSVVPAVGYHKGVEVTPRDARRHLDGVHAGPAGVLARHAAEVRPDCRRPDVGEADDARLRPVGLRSRTNPVCG